MSKSKENEEIYICGDFNIDQLNLESNNIYMSRIL